LPATVRFYHGGCRQPRVLMRHRAAARAQLAAPLRAIAARGLIARR